MYIRVVFHCSFSLTFVSLLSRAGRERFPVPDSIDVHVDTLIFKFTFFSSFSSLRWKNVPFEINIYLDSFKTSLT